MSVTSTDPFWSALAAYDTGAGQAALSAGTAAPASAGTQAPSSVSSEAKLATLMELMGGAAVSPGASTANSLAGNSISGALAGQPGSAPAAVQAAVGTSLLDTLL
ncbi:MAG: hypothetical protein ACYCXN_09865 [Acidimicrobiales bacterium]|jgi:hypothetical protein